MKWALIGASTIAEEHMIPAIRAQEGNTISVLVSTSANHAHIYAKAQGVAAISTDLQAALKQHAVDAVYISSTNEKHFPQAMSAITAGVHVLCEKPLAMTVGDATTMVMAARAVGVVFATNHHLRCAGSHRTVRQLVTDGKIGKVLSMRIFHAVHLPAKLRGWRINSAAAGGGVVADIGVHNLDTARFILGEDPISVMAQTGTSGMGQGVEDSAMSIWSMPSGTMVMSHESFTHPFAGSGLEIHGTNGSIFARDVMTQKPLGSIELRTETGCENVPFSDHDLYVEGVRMFVSAVRKTGDPAANGWDGVKSLAFAHAALVSAREERRVTVDYGVTG